jgi:hypothetical protein
VTGPRISVSPRVSLSIRVSPSIRVFAQKGRLLSWPAARGGDRGASADGGVGPVS